jgi:hypothetical protein
MAFDFELSISGLCLLTFKGDKRKPDEVDVLLVKTLAPDMPGMRGGNGKGHDHGNGHDDGHRHFPRLTYFASDLTDRSSKDQILVPAANGQQFGQRDLEGKDGLELEALGVKPGIEAVWHPDPDHHNAPTQESEERYLDWIPTLRNVDPAVPAPAGELPFLGLLKAEVTAWLKVTQGRLEASQVARGISGQYLLWNFKTTAGQFDPKKSQALAGRVVLRLGNLDQPVQIRGLGGDGKPVEFAPVPSPGRTGRPLVQVSITNLPDKEVFPSPTRLVHFGQFFGLVKNPPADDKIHLPETASQLDTTVGSFCPPGSHTS